MKQVLVDRLIYQGFATAQADTPHQDQDEKGSLMHSLAYSIGGLTAAVIAELVCITSL